MNFTTIVKVDLESPRQELSNGGILKMPQPLRFSAINCVRVSTGGRIQLYAEYFIFSSYLGLSREKTRHFKRQNGLCRYSVEHEK